jgi:predicted membrane protein
MSRCDGNSGRVSGHIAFGVFLLVVGLLALLNNLNIINIPPLTRLIWPALIIWVGLNMIWRGRAITGVKNEAATDSKDGLIVSTVLGGVDRKISSRDFAGGSVSAFLGGVNLDFRDAEMKGDEATLDVFAMMGGIGLMVPPNWIVESRVTPLLGGYEDKTHPAKESTKRLIIRGTVALGGVEVKR